MRTELPARWCVDETMARGIEGGQLRELRDSHCHRIEAKSSELSALCRRSLRLIFAQEAGIDEAEIRSRYENGTISKVRMSGNI